MGPLSLLVLQGTPFCNIDCQYCYLPDRLDKSKMDLDVVSKAIDRIIEADIIDKRFTVLWHAGEPLVMPISFYSAAIDLIRNKIPRDKDIKQNIQTNLTLINQEWCDFIKNNNIDLGISIDGPEEFNDRYRVDRKGKGTFYKLMKGIELLKKNNIPLRAISVLTRQSALFPDQMYNFYKENGFDHVGFNIDEIEAANSSSTYSDVTDAEDIIYFFFKRFFELHKLYNKPFTIREIDNSIAKLKFSPISGLDTLVPSTDIMVPFKIITVATNGDFSTFCPELINYNTTEKYGSLVLGNVNRDSFSDVMKTLKFKHIYNDIQLGIEACRTNCEYFGLCEAGYPSNKLAEKGTFAADETMSCRLIKKTTIDVILDEALEELIGISHIPHT